MLLNIDIIQAVLLVNALLISISPNVTPISNILNGIVKLAIVLNDLYNHGTVLSILNIL